MNGLKAELQRTDLRYWPGGNKEHDLYGGRWQIISSTEAEKENPGIKSEGGTRELNLKKK